MAEIQLTRGFVALIDDADAAWASQWKWHASGDGGRFTYAARDGSRILLHRDLLGLGRGNNPIVDHANGNTLDCRRANIRICSYSQNLANRGPLAGRRFKGVYQHRLRWQTKAKANGQRFYLGSYTSEIEAAKAFDAFARETWGEFAKLNFPEDR